MTSRQTSTKVLSQRDAQGLLEQERSRQDRLASAIDEYYAAVDAGKAPDRERLLEKYADIAEELSDCLQNLDFIQNVAPQLSDWTAKPDDSTGHSQSLNLGDFRIEREIGRGGMGVVYEAEQLSLGRRVALKVLPFAAMLDRQQLKRFKNEARAAATLDHPNIVGVFSVGEERGVHYYAMQLVEGKSLAEVLGQLRTSRGVTLDKAGGQAGRTIALAQGRVEMPISVVSTGAPGDPQIDGSAPPQVPPTTDTKRDLQAAVSTDPAFDTQEYHRNIARLGVQAARALDHAHQFGILHRDVKPGNLLVDMEGELQVTDFGLARIESDAGMTMSGDLLGTLAYMSPEQALAKRVVVDHRSDIYSLGVTLYELLTLHPAYVGQDRQELLRKIAFDEPRRPRQLNRRIPPDLETIVCKAIEKNPEDRYSTAQELADDLQRFLSDQPIHASPPNLRQRFAKWSRRNQGLVTATAAVMALLLLATSIATALVWHEQGLAQTALEEMREQKSVAEQEKLRAEQSAAENAALVDFFVDDLLGAIEPSRSRGKAVSVAEVVEGAEEKLEQSFVGQPLLEAKIRIALAKLNGSLSRHERAEAHFRQAVEIQQRELGITRQTLQTMQGLAGTVTTQNRDAEAVELLRQLVLQREEALGVNDEDTLESMAALASCLGGLGKIQEAHSLLLTVRARSKHVSSSDRKRYLAYVKTYQAHLAALQGDHEQAKKNLNEAMEIGEDAFQATEALYAAWQLGKHLWELKELEEARQIQTKVVDGFRAAVGPTDNRTLQATSDLARTLFTLTTRGLGDHRQPARKLIRAAAVTAYEHKQWDSLYYACWIGLNPKRIDDPTERAEFNFFAAIALSHAEGTSVDVSGVPNIPQYYFEHGVKCMSQAGASEALRKLHDEAAALLEIEGKETDTKSE